MRDKLPLIGPSAQIEFECCCHFTPFALNKVETLSLFLATSALSFFSQLVASPSNYSKSRANLNSAIYFLKELFWGH